VARAATVDAALAVVANACQRRVTTPDRLAARSAPAGSDPRITPGWIDVCYEEYGILGELDGRLGHSDVADNWRDMRRDSRAVLAGEASLRYG
jgi:hypothetical protein